MTKLHDLVDNADLTQGISAGLINVRYDGNHLRILNYSDKAMYTPGAWDNPAVRVCRGLIADDHYNVIARPWEKFFNHGQIEAGALQLDTPVQVTDKMDGSLGILYRDFEGTIKVATRGSFESDQALHATEVLRRDGHNNLLDVSQVTPLVEIIYPENRIVCDYGDRDELVLLGGVRISTGEYLGPLDTMQVIGWSGPVVKRFSYPTLRDALAAAPRKGAEGLCVRYLHENKIVKIKQEDYVALHKLVTGLSEKVVWQHMFDNEPLGELLASLPDELHSWTTGVWDHIAEQAYWIDAGAEDLFNAALREVAKRNRKDFADIVRRDPGLAPFVFQMLDNKSPRQSILKTLKPVSSKQYRYVSEEAA